MEVTLKKTRLTKSIILQMSYAGVPVSKELEVLGWVNMGKHRWVIVKIGDEYFRSEFIVEVEKRLENCQFPLKDGGYEYPKVHKIFYKSYNRGIFSSYSPQVDDKVNLDLYERLVEFKRKTMEVGQIYY